MIEKIPITIHISSSKYEKEERSPILKEDEKIFEIAVRVHFLVKNYDENPFKKYQEFQRFFAKFNKPQKIFVLINRLNFSPLFLLYYSSITMYGVILTSVIESKENIYNYVPTHRLL